MKKYVYVCEPYSKNIPRSAILVSRYLAEINNTEVIPYSKIKEYRDKFYFIFIYQVPHTYKKYYTPRLYNKNDIIVTRAMYADRYIRSFSNGFSYFIENKNISDFYPIPFTHNKPISTHYVDNINIGIYCRPKILPYSINEFLVFIKKHESKINCIYLSGVKYDEIYKYTNIPIIHTYSQSTFFDNISHFWYSMDKQHADPWPTMLMESVQCNKQIIINNVNRSFNDGIDDIISCIKYHVTLNDNIYYDNRNCIINSELFENWHKKNIMNHYNINLCRNKYTTFRDWCENELY